MLWRNPRQNLDLTMCLLACTEVNCVGDLANPCLRRQNLMSTARYLIPYCSQMVYTNPAPLPLLTCDFCWCCWCCWKQPGAKRQNLILEQLRGVLRWWGDGSSQRELCIQKQAANIATYLGLIWINWCYLCLWYPNADPGGGSSHETSGHLGDPFQVQSCHGLIHLPQ